MSKSEIIAEAKFACGMMAILMPLGLLSLLSPELMHGRLSPAVFAVLAGLILAMIMAGGRLLACPQPRNAIVAAAIGIVSFTFCNALVSWEAALFPALQALSATIALVLPRREEAMEDR